MKKTNELPVKAFAAYMPCKLVSTGGKITDLVMVGEYPVIAWDENSERKWGDSRYEWQKIQLHRLSELSDEHATEVARILGVEYSNTPDSEKYFDLEGLKSWLIEDVFVSSIGFQALNILTAIELADYLRSKGYALPFHGVDLIDAKIAEYAQTTAQ